MRAKWAAVCGLAAVTVLAAGAQTPKPVNGQAENSGATSAVQTPASTGNGFVPGHKVSGPNPTYPADALKDLREGVVVLKATITTAGDVANIAVMSSPGEAFSKAAISAFQQWKFSPYMRDGEPIDFEVQLPIRFVIEP